MQACWNSSNCQHSYHIASTESSLSWAIPGALEETSSPGVVRMAHHALALSMAGHGHVEECAKPKNKLRVQTNCLCKKWRQVRLGCVCLLTIVRRSKIEQAIAMNDSRTSKQSKTYYERRLTSIHIMSTPRSCKYIGPAILSLSAVNNHTRTTERPR